MKKLRIWLVLSACAILFCGCEQLAAVKSPIIIDETPSSIQDLNIDQTDNKISSGENAVEDDTLPPHSGMVRSRLTNEWVDEAIASTRPIAVMIPNESSAIPHYSLSKASVLYEANVEGRMTRMMAIFEDWETLDRIGNVRSLRAYYAYWAFEWDAFIVHVGYPFFVSNLVATADDVDGSLGDVDAQAFFRSTDRRSPHNTYATGSGIMAAVRQKGYSPVYRGLTDERHYNFTTKSSPNTLAQYGSDAKNATYIDMSGCYPLTRCYFEYNEDDALYYRSQHLSGGLDGPHVDAEGIQLAFKNILVQNTVYEELGEGYLAFQCHDNTSDGWYFTNGLGIHVNWIKNSDYDATRYYDDNGNEIVMNTGKTMVCIVESGDLFTFK